MVIWVASHWKLFFIIIIILFVFVFYINFVFGVELVVELVIIQLRFVRLIKLASIRARGHYARFDFQLVLTDKWTDFIAIYDVTLIVITI